MGGRLCTHVVDLSVTGHLDNHTDKGRLTLLIMASIGRDEPNPKTKIERGVYYGGWEMLARALGYKEYTAAAERAVARAIAELTEAGLIEPVGTPTRGQRQAYKLTLPQVF
jgi:hypothetical protein